MDVSRFFGDPLKLKQFIEFLSGVSEERTRIYLATMYGASIIADMSPEELRKQSRRVKNIIVALNRKGVRGWEAVRTCLLKLLGERFLTQIETYTEILSHYCRVLSGESRPSNLGLSSGVRGAENKRGHSA